MSEAGYGNSMTCAIELRGDSNSVAPPCGLRILADWIGLGSLASLLVVAVALAAQATTEGLEAGAWWALVLPAGGILGARVLHATAHRLARWHAEQA